MEHPPRSGTATRGPNLEPETVSGSRHLVHTDTDIQAWGQRVVNWGKKVKGKTFAEAYQQEAEYCNWVCNRMDGGTLSPEIQSFGRYVMSRRVMEL